MFDSFIDYHARQRPLQTALVTPSGGLSYAQLDAAVSRFAGALADIRLPSDACVSVRLASPVTRWMITLALARLGICSTSSHDVGATYAIGEEASSDEAGHPGRGFHASAEWLAAVWAGTAPPRAVIRPEPGRLGRVLLSSGTSGEAKRVGLSWALIDANIRNAVLAYGPVIGGPWLLTPSIDTVLGFTVTLAAWVAGHAVMFRDGLNWPDTLRRFEPGLIGIVPVQLRDMLRELPAGFAAARPPRLIVTGGAMPPALAREARLRLTSDIRIVYGATECGAATIADAALLDVVPGVAGYAMPDVRIQIIGPRGEAMPSGEPGEVRISGSRLARYLDPEQPGFGPDGFAPGDRGRLLPDGLLVIEGRVDEMINFGGIKLAPETIEAAIAGCPGVADAAAFALPNPASMDQCWLAVVAGADFDPQTLATHIGPSLPPLSTVRTLIVDRLPRNAMGKVERAALRALAQTLFVT